MTDSDLTRRRRRIWRVRVVAAAVVLAGVVVAGSDVTADNTDVSSVAANQFVQSYDLYYE